MVNSPPDKEYLNPDSAMIAERVRRYWVLGMECSFLEIQKLAWFLDRAINAQQLKNTLTQLARVDLSIPSA